jgi:hypothetical protein
MNSERKSQVSDEELEDDGINDENEFFSPEDNWDEEECDEDDEPYEREYCD